MHIIIRIGIVDYEHKEDNNYIDEYPDLNIYEKICILIYESNYPKESTNNSINKSFFINSSKTKTKTKPIPIPNKNNNI